MDFRDTPISRRAFLGRTLSVAGTGVANRLCAAAQKTEARVRTVLGPIKPDELGPTLAHEHVMCDFIGAGQTGRHRWVVDDVVRRMLPVLNQLKSRGIRGFVDCTPAFIGRDPRVLRRLAQETGLHILTNTGYYGGAGDKFVPQHAYEESADELADRWIREAEQGIEDTGILPGFMKIGVDEAAGDPPALSAIDAKLVRAAALASKRTGLAVVCHTGGGAAGLAAARLFVHAKGDPGRFVVAHSDGHGLHINRQVAGLGAWVSFDAISRQPLEQHLKLVAGMVDQHAGRLLLSQDNGWYWIGQKEGGEIRDFNYFTDLFLPALRKGGVTEALVQQLTVDNPRIAFSISAAD